MYRFMILGSPLIELILSANWLRLSRHLLGLRFEFPFSKAYLASLSAEIPEGTTPKTPVKTPDRILATLRENPNLTLVEVATALEKSTSAIERAAKKLSEAGKLRYVGPQKGGHWEVIESEDG